MTAKAKRRTKCRTTRRTDALWVVEMWNGREWEPTTHVGVYPRDGRDMLAAFRGTCPHYKSHLAKYVRASR